MARCCIGLLFALAIKNLAVGKLVLALLIFVLLAMQIADVLAVRYGREIPVPVPVALAMVVVTVLATVVYCGPEGAVWAFPAIIGANLVERRRPGVASGLVLTGAVPLLVLNQGEPVFALRLFFALATTAAFIWFSVSRTSLLQSRLLVASTRDPLTGCYNRRVLGWKARQLRASRSVLLLIDIDHFKSVNDDFGHAAGDEVLKTVAALIAGELRERDQLFRLGGEEFLVMLEGSTSALSTHVAERIRARIETATILPGRRITVSIGMSELTGEDSLAAALRRADQQLYAAKNQGRNRIGNPTHGAPAPDKA